MCERQILASENLQPIHFRSQMAQLISLLKQYLVILVTPNFETMYSLQYFHYASSFWSFLRQSFRDHHCWHTLSRSIWGPEDWKHFILISLSKWSGFHRLHVLVFMEFITLKTVSQSTVDTWNVAQMSNGRAIIANCSSLSPNWTTLSNVCINTHLIFSETRNLKS